MACSKIILHALINFAYREQEIFFNQFFTAASLALAENNLKLWPVDSWKTDTDEPICHVVGASDDNEPYLGHTTGWVHANVQK